MAGFATFFRLIAATLLTMSPVRAGEIDDVMGSLGVSLPISIAHMAAVRRPLEELSRERCDRTAIANLGDALQKLGRRREAATVQISFSKNCNGDAASVRRAVNMLLQLNDYEEVVSTATELIKIEPYGDNGYYLRALGHDRGGNCKKAIDDYATAIELFGNKERISEAGYFGMMRCYEKLDQFCEAMTPIEAWVALNPARNDTSRTRTILAELSMKGNCTATAAAGEASEEVVPIARTGRTITVSGAINGVSGRFILDTGATFVALKRSFAQRANVNVDESSSIKLATANGITEARRGHAKSVALKKLSAQNVAIVVQSDDRATYGEKIDGLLGMSFLSRFDMSIDAKYVRLKPRSRR